MQLQKAFWLLCLLTPACASSDTAYREPIEAWQESRAQRWDAAQQNADIASNETLAPDAQLPELLAYGRQHNPKLSVAFYRWQAAVEQIPQASKLPEPRVMFATFLEEVETRTGPM
ncbi:MAG: outer membrane protein TolC, partial [Planctomycetota bacterium]